MLIAPVPVLAASSTNVTVTATGWICGAPDGFAVFYISDYEVGISWVKGEGAENTMIRAKYGSYPVDRADGNLVYYGDGVVASDTGVNFDEGVADVYYRAWSEDAGEVWEEIGTTNFMENPYMLLIVLVGLAFGFTIASAVLKKGWLAYSGAGGWIIAAIYCFSRHTVTWDTYFSLGFLFLALMLACFFAPLAYKETTMPGEKTEDPDTAEMQAEMAEFNKGRNQFSFLHKKSPRRKPRW